MTSHASITGQTLAHYEVLEQVGEGGMGVVYKARDTQLDRIVAIKVLGGRRIAEPSATERFLQEAKAASALNHPSIVTIYGVDLAGDVDFISMEYVAGQPLDRLMSRRGCRCRPSSGMRCRWRTPLPLRMLLASCTGI